MRVYKDWADLKPQVTEKQRLRYLDRDAFYAVSYGDIDCSIQKDAGADQVDFETNYKGAANTSVGNEVTTQMEKNDKDLRMVCGWTTTDANGEAEFAWQIPAKGRYVAYGDLEFETRHIRDSVVTLEVTDLDRLIAWQIALQMDPNATEPVPDSVVQANGFPDYPVVGHYDERELPGTPSANTKGNPSGGMSMIFQYGITEAQPVAGYGFIPEGMYLRVIAKKDPNATPQAGVVCTMSIDWAEPRT